MRRRSLVSMLFLAPAILSGCNPNGACVSTDIDDHCFEATKHGCVSTMAGKKPGTFHANNSCTQVGYTYAHDNSSRKPPSRPS